eukprot:jgi/Bigna1/66856/fgenesh1_pg.2_\
MRFRQLGKGSRPSSLNRDMEAARTLIVGLLLSAWAASYLRLWGEEKGGSETDELPPRITILDCSDNDEAQFDIYEIAKSAQPVILRNSWVTSSWLRTQPEGFWSLTNISQRCRTSSSNSRRRRRNHGDRQDEGTLSSHGYGNTQRTKPLMPRYVYAQEDNSTFVMFRREKASGYRDGGEQGGARRHWMSQREKDTVRVLHDVGLDAIGYSEYSDENIDLNTNTLHEPFFFYIRIMFIPYFAVESPPGEYRYLFGPAEAYCEDIVAHVPKHEEEKENCDVWTKLRTHYGDLFVRERRFRDLVETMKPTPTILSLDPGKYVIMSKARMMRRISVAESRRASSTDAQVRETSAKTYYVSVSVVVNPAPTLPPTPPLTTRAQCVADDPAALSFSLRPGDVLYIPPYWFHLIQTAKGPSSISQAAGGNGGGGGGERGVGKTKHNEPEQYQRNSASKGAFSVTVVSPSKEEIFYGKYVLRKASFSTAYFAKVDTTLSTRARLIHGLTLIVALLREQFSSDTAAAASFLADFISIRYPVSFVESWKSAGLDCGVALAASGLDLADRSIRLDVARALSEESGRDKDSVLRSTVARLDSLFSKIGGDSHGILEILLADFVERVVEWAFLSPSDAGHEDSGVGGDGQKRAYSGTTATKGANPSDQAACFIVNLLTDSAQLPSL